MYVCMCVCVCVKMERSWLYLSNLQMKGLCNKFTSVYESFFDSKILHTKTSQPFQNIIIVCGYPTIETASVCLTL